MTTLVEQFQQACVSGDLAIAMKLGETMTPEDARADDNSVLRMACLFGHLAIAQWLTNHFNLTVEDARAEDNGALCGACVHGHFDVAQ